MSSHALSHMTLTEATSKSVHRCTRGEGSRRSEGERGGREVWRGGDRFLLKDGRGPFAQESLSAEGPAIRIGARAPSAAGKDSRFGKHRPWLCRLPSATPRDGETMNDWRRCALGSPRAIRPGAGANRRPLLSHAPLEGGRE
jgi:hypothetical protein